MGVQLGDIWEAEKAQLADFKGKIITVDAFNTLYQFLSIIRQPDGQPLMDANGNVTSHLAGLLYRTSNLLEVGIKPVFIFDGKPPELKRATVESRRAVREKARIEWKEALERGDMERARTKAQQTSRLTSGMIDEAKQLLDYLGLPWLDAPSEGECQASYMARKGDAWAAASQDFDSLLFGTPILVRNLTVSGKRKLPRQKIYVDVVPEILNLDEGLAKLGITREQLVDVAILVGTDFNPGIKGIGPKKGLKYVKQHGTLEKVLEARELELLGYEDVRNIFLNPEVTDDYTLDWGTPDPDGIRELLCEKHGFAVNRVDGALKKVGQGRAARQQKSLDAWF